jgi:hypothetical protein
LGLLAAGPAGVGAAEEKLVVHAENGALRIEFAASRLALSVPKRGFIEDPGRREGAAASPRYFALREAIGPRTTVVSGWFEGRARFTSVKKLWAAELKAAKTPAAEAPRRVTFAKIAGWETVAYERPAPSTGAGAAANPKTAPASTHLRAHWLQGDTWIELHLSMTGPVPAEEARAALVALLKSVAVSEIAAEKK